MSLRNEARATTEYSLRQRDAVVRDREELLAQLRASDEWRQDQLAKGNGILQTVPDLIKRRATDGHMSAWIMDINPDQYVDAETQSIEFPIQAVQVKLHGAARIVGEYLIQEGLSVFIRHKGKLNGVHIHQMEARWS